MWNVRFVRLVGVVVAATAMRLVPHPPNVTPIAAIALFGGAHFASKRAAVAVPLLAMCLSDPPPRLRRPPSDAVRLRQLRPHRGPRPADRGSSLDACRGRRRFDRVGAVLRHHELRRVALE